MLEKHLGPIPGCHGIADPVPQLSEHGDLLDDDVACRPELGLVGLGKRARPHEEAKAHCKAGTERGRPQREVDNRMKQDGR